VQYSIPAPKGGRNNKDLILAEDAHPQFLKQQQRKAAALANKSRGSATTKDVWETAAEFGAAAAKAAAKASVQNSNKNVHGYGRTNRNAVKNKGKKRK
jgi:hypothetical protein